LIVDRDGASSMVTIRTKKIRRIQELKMATNGFDAVTRNHFWE
jgi:hypothetical protein